jgi:hypothetical protein
MAVKLVLSNDGHLFKAIRKWEDFEKNSKRIRKEFEKRIRKENSKRGRIRKEGEFEKRENSK